MMYKESPVVFMRGGALGDFILSLPLLKAMAELGGNITLVTRGSYRSLLPDDLAAIPFIDIDGADVSALFAENARFSQKVEKAFSGAELVVFTALDPIFRENCHEIGVKKIFTLDSRPTVQKNSSKHGCRHVAEGFFIDSELPVPEKLLETSILREKNGSDLWLHPGSGSRSKNAPVSIFADLAESWRSNHSGEIHVSFGEADQEVVDPFEREFRRRSIPFRSVVMPDLGNLKRLMGEKAGWYAGNDTGVTHLAAALGISTTVFFVSTPPEIWRPLGNVEVVDLRS